MPVFERTLFFVVATMMTTMLSAATTDVMIDCWHGSGGCPRISGFDPSMQTQTQDYDGLDYPNGTVLVCSFNGSMAPLAIVTDIRVDASMQRIGLHSFFPSVSASINGQTIGGIQSINSASTQCGTQLRLYPYLSTTYPSGFPSYDNLGLNQLQLQLVGDIYIEGALAKVTYTFPPPMVFNISDQTPERDRRVLISRQRNDDSGYHGNQTQNAKVPLVATISDGNGNPLANATVYLRITDPPDPSAYVPNPNVANHDTAAGSLSGAAITALGSKNYSAVSDANGKIAMDLEITHSAAGDNYQIEGSFDQAYSCAPACAHTGVLTAWKRIYIEKDQMFRAGSFLRDSAPAGSSTIPVLDVAAFAVGQTIRVIHAPRLDSTGPPTFYGETHLIASIDRMNHSTAGVLHLGTSTAPTQLANSYGLDNSVAGAVVLNDAVGVVRTGGLYDVDPRYVTSLFDTAYVEFESASQTVAEIPFKATWNPPTEPSALGFIASKWVENASRNATIRTTLPNHFQVMAFSEKSDVITNNPCQATIQLGETVSDAHNLTTIYTGRIERLVTQSNLAKCGGVTVPNPYRSFNVGKLNGETLVHEYAHQWKVNEPTPPPLTQGHCSNNQFNSPALFCTMNSAQNSTQMNDDVVAFHFLAGPPINSEYFTIRDAVDPIP